MNMATMAAATRPAADWMRVADEVVGAVDGIGVGVGVGEGVAGGGQQLAVPHTCVN